LEWRREGPRTLGHRTANECAVAELLHAYRQLSSTGLTPLRVSFQHPAPSDTREHERFFGTRVVFGAAWDGYTLPRAALETVPRASNPALSAYLEAQMQEALKTLPEAVSLVERVRVLIAQELASGEPSMPGIARRLHLGERTLRRELAEAGATFRELVEQVRRERALELLRSGQASLTEVAFLLGFSEASAFTRAFKRWHGVPPGEFRKVG
jgi:AraC-like DNA-binding protein